MLRFKNELREEDLIFAFVHQESAHDFRLLDMGMRQRKTEASNPMRLKKQ